MSGDEEEVAILVAEIDRLKKVEEERTQPNWFVLLWRRLFGVLVYGGPRTCAHCKYWKAPRVTKTMVKCTKGWHDNHYCDKSWHWAIKDAPSKGDCRLLFGKEDTDQGDVCDRFRARRRYKHRVRYDSWVAKGIGHKWINQK